jgi:hypothetical protein
MVERGLLRPNTLTIQLPAVFIGLRPTGLPGSVKEFILHVLSAQLDEGMYVVSKADIALAIGQARGSVSSSGLKLVLAELWQGTTRAPPRLLRVAPGRYTMRGGESP